jgi:pimeloyl-ACP methyl ester carboxylesterase
MPIPPEHLSEIARRRADADTIVLVPGLDGTALLFYRQIPLLAKRFNVVAFPLPNESDRTMKDLVDELRTLIDEVAPRGAILCGESFGGALSLSTALAHPDAVRGLVILNSFSRIPQRAKLRAAPFALKLVPWGAMPLVRRFTEHRLHSPHALPEDLAEFRERSKQIGKEGYIRRLEILWHYDVREDLQRIEAPTLFLASDRDQLIPSVDEAEFMSARVPKSEMQVLEGFGHICLINHDLDLLDHVGPWWERVATERAGYTSRGSRRATVLPTSCSRDSRA